ncbi:MAG TPA: transglutaminase-like domain-containing protein, partial [Rectinemataceae bacterium]
SQKNPQARAMLVRDWLMKNLAWEEKPQKISPVAALKRKRADSSNYAILACALLRAAQVPAVPLSGFLLTDDGKLIPHLWLEYYLPGLGWIPFDPVLTKGGKPGGFQGKLESDQRYFGNLDNRHIAFSRGYEKDRPRLAGGTVKASGPFWILQDLFEESVNASYTSSWNQPRLVGEILEPQAGDTPR